MTFTQLLDELAQAVRSLVQLYQLNYVRLDPRKGTSVCVRQYTQNICVCPSAHTGCPWLSVCVRVCLSAHTGRLWLSISIHISTLLLGLSTLTLPVDCSDDFGPRGLSVQYTQDVCGCPPAHTGHPWLSVCVCQHTQDVRWCPSAHTGSPLVSVSTHRTSVAVRVCPCVSVSIYRTSVTVHQYTYQHVGPWTQHADPSRGLFGTHISTLVLGLSTLALPVDCWGDFGPRGLSFQYTQDLLGCPPAYTGRLWLSVCVRQHTQDVCGCLFVSVSTHMTSVADNQYTYQHTLVLRLSTLALPEEYSGDFGPRGLSVQYTQDVRGCPSIHTGYPWLSVCVRVCPSAYTGHLWLSISTHISPLYTQDVRGSPPAHTGRPTDISTLVLRLSMLALPVDCLGDIGPCGLSVQYTQDVRGCPSAHIGRLWHTQDVCGCPSVHISARCYLDQHADPSLGLCGNQNSHSVIRRVAADGILYGCRGKTTMSKLAGFSEDVRILAKRQILGSRIRVFDTMPRDVRDQCAGFRARPRFTPGFRGCDD
ncbi:hypothetical protein YC2023_004394 [Brassica napus]